MTQENKAQSKSLLAKLLATENITIQQSAKVMTASFDIKNRILTLPVWQGISNDLEDMLVVHEVGHALDTPLVAWKNAIENITINIYGKLTTKNERAVQSFLNIVEDARIDKRQKRRYPGSRRNYLVGYKELIERDFFGTAKRDINSFSFIDRLNIYFKGGVAMDITFSNEEKVWINRAANTETFDEVVKLTEEIFAFCKSKGEDMSKEANTDSHAGIDEDEDEDYDYEDSDGDGEGDEYTDEEAEEGEKEKPKDSSKSKDKSEDKSEQTDDAGSTGEKGGESKGDDFIPEAETEKAWEEKQSELVSNDATEYVYVTVPTPNMKNIADDYKVFINDNKAYVKKMTSWHGSGWYDKAMTEFTKFRKEEASAISFMVKEFEMKKSADIFSRISIAKTGVLDTNKIHSYKYNDDIFRRQTIVPAGKNHGFVMVLDWSGSMTTNIRETLKQLISLTMFCKRVQIPFEVYMFRDLCRADDHNKAAFEHKANDIGFENFRMRNILSSRMNSSELNQAYTLLWAMSVHCSDCDPMGGTPLNQAIVATEFLVKQFRERSKVQIVNTIFLTDGGSNGIKGVMQDSKTVRRTSTYDSIGTRKKVKYILQDKVMKKDYHFFGSTLYGQMNGEEVTTNLLKILKDRVGGNLIGFYLYDYANFKNVAGAFFGGTSNLDTNFFKKMQHSWSENKFVPVTNFGYDDYYVLNARAMKFTNTGILSVDSTMSKAKIAKSFMTFSEKKSLNRVLLQRFIAKIATEKMAG